jgi:hypothetical protein
MSLTSEPAEAAPSPKRAAMPRLGEELPIFCERCGYSLHGLPQSTCEHCTILQFHCPECGHHQPINTLRPAVQNMLGRVRAVALVGSVVLKLAFFGLLLFAWCGMGAAWMYRYSENSYVQDAKGQYTQVAPRQVPLKFSEVNFERLMAFGIFGFAFGCVSRMLLLRWRLGPLIGATVAGLVSAAILLGVSVEYWTSLDSPFPLALPYRGGFFFLVAYTATIIIIAASVVWPIWCGLVKAFLPRRASGALLDWQRSMSDPSVPQNVRSALARDRVTSAEP